MKKQFILVLGLLFLSSSTALAHSWLELPPPRDAFPVLSDPSIPNDEMAHAMTFPDGCPFSRSEGLEMTYQLPDGTLRPVGDPFGMARVNRGSELCVRWASNGHFNDPLRGFLNVSLVQSGTATQAEFDANVLVQNVDYSFFEGIRVPIPADTPVGINTLQFAWWYCGAKHFYVSCADVMVVDGGAPSYGLRPSYSGPRGQCQSGVPPLPAQLPAGAPPQDMATCPTPAPRPASTGGGDTPPPPTPSSERGLYISIWHTPRGTNPAEQNYAFILDSPERTNTLLNLIRTQGFTTISFYNFHRALSAGRATQLATFMNRARQEAGVRRIGAIATTYEESWDIIADFHHNQAPFDDLLTEIEFWNPMGVDARDTIREGENYFDLFTRILRYMHSLGLTATDGNPVRVMAYIGRIRADEKYSVQEKANRLAELTDVVLVHHYVDDPAVAINYDHARIERLNAAGAALNKVVQWMPIYSAEGVEYSVGAEHFMGEWLRANSVPLAEQIYRSDYTSGAHYHNLNLVGFYWYENRFVDYYLNTTAPPPPPVPTGNTTSCPTKLDCSMLVSISYDLQNRTVISQSVNPASCSVSGNSSSGGSGGDIPPPPPPTPTGKCRTDADCPVGSWCKSWQTPDENGMWWCQGF